MTTIIEKIRIARGGVGANSHMVANEILTGAIADLEALAEEMRTASASVIRKNMSRPSTYLDYVEPESIEAWADRIGTSSRKESV